MLVEVNNKAAAKVTVGRIALWTDVSVLVVRWESPVTGAPLDFTPAEARAIAADIEEGYETFGGRLGGARLLGAWVMDADTAATVAALRRVADAVEATTAPDGMELERPS
jgi:hypothetical protein